MRAFLSFPAGLLPSTGWLRLSVVSLIGLITALLAWEAWILPSGAVWPAVKSLPLLALLPGLLRARRSTAQWASILGAFYLMGGVIRVFGYFAAPSFTTAAELGPALAQLLLAITLIASTSFYAFHTRFQFPREGP